MNKHTNGLTWFKWIAKTILTISAIRLLFAFGYSDVPFQVFQVLFQSLISVIVFGGIAYALGWLAGKDSDNNRRTSLLSASQTVSASSLPASLQMSSTVTNSASSVRPATSLPSITYSAMTTQSPAFDEDAIYEIVANEMESGTTDKGMWTRLFAELDGDEKRIKIAYIKQRAEKLIAAERVRFQEQERRRTEEMARLDRLRTEGKPLRELVSSGCIAPEMAERLRSLSSSHGAVMFLNGVRLNQVEQTAKFIDENSLYVAVANSEGLSPLHISAAEGYLAMTELLIQKGAPVDAKDMNGQRPLDIARKCNNQQLVALLSAMD